MYICYTKEIKVLLRGHDYHAKRLLTINLNKQFKRINVKQNKRRSHIVAVFTPSISVSKTGSPEAVKKCSLITAIKTPYLPDGKFDLSSYDKIVKNQVILNIIISKNNIIIIKKRLKMGWKD